MALFKDVKKPVIRQSPRAADISPLRPKFVAKQPPCSGHCGAGADVRAWVTTIAQAEAGGLSLDQASEAAWRVVAETHPFPATLGRICPASCEQACYRRSKEGAVAVNALERWLGDVALARGFALPQAVHSGRSARIAVVGAGPAGLSCAYHLARRGHSVTTFESSNGAGGRLRDAIRTGRLRADILDAEIARVLALGIALKCDSPVTPDFRALGERFDFAFVATGRQSRDKWADVREAPVRPGLVEGRTNLRVMTGGDLVAPGLVSAALAAGRRAAEAIDAAINGTAPPTMVDAPAIAVERLTLAWYPDAPPHAWPVEREAASNGDAASVKDAEIVAEAKRCMSCGFCMDCERCWMYCTNNCFEKRPKTSPDLVARAGVKPGAYELHVDKCNGCRKCADECPCGYIDLV